MKPRINLLILLLITAGLISTLAIPWSVWRTGRLENPPLDLVNGRQLAMNLGRLWIDTDAACGASARTDPDDCLAILWLARKGYRIEGISTAYGNAGPEVVERVTRALAAKLEVVGKPRIRVWRGLAAPLAEADEDVPPGPKALRAALAESPLTVLALGPLTNVAAALAGRPDLQDNVRQLVAVMGHRPGHIFHPSEGSGHGNLLGHGPVFRDLNVALDPEAARSVLNMNLSTVLVPYDAARRVKITKDDLDRLAADGSASAWVADRSREWLDYWRDDIGQPGFYPFDWVAAAFLAAPERFHCAQAKGWIQEELTLWLVPLSSLLVGPAAPADAVSDGAVVYCPRVDPSLHGLLTGGAG
ncbi:MAG: nucleoside hydrolase [Alphaproteobacteria bacterium]